jgi:hypothetical protein
VSAAERRKRIALPALLSSNDLGDYATASSRLLWPAFALLIPTLAVALGKPMRRSSSWLGLTLGLILMVMFIRSTGFVAAGRSAHPGLVALGTVAVWLATVSSVAWGERKWGPGYVDHWLLKAIGRTKLGLRLRAGRCAPGSA